MCEESACLVPPENNSNNSIEGRYNNSLDGAGLLGSTSTACSRNGEALVGFHEDALSQANAGKAQLMLTLVLGLALAAECSEITIVGFLLPAAELQLCIDEHRKGWLVSITLLALSIGSVGWGILGDRVGRRRALLSALSVAALFSTVAAVMPTYGTFMTARFCSGMGIAGAMPLAYSYLAENCPRSTRTRYLGMLHAFWPLGALFAATLAHCVLPTDGASIVQDNREHWNSWHKFLILNITPIIAAIIGLIWASESPRYLLDARREVEALEVYQRLHRLNKTSTQYGLTELELPGRNAYSGTRSASLGGNAGIAGGARAGGRGLISYGLDTIVESFRRLVTPTHLRTTLLLAALHLICGMVLIGVSTVASAMITDINEEEYVANKRHVYGYNYTNVLFNATLDNVQYSDCVFRRTAFKHIELKHVQFDRCYFDEVEFADVRSSVTYFENCTIFNSRFVDTDLSDNRFLNTRLINNTFLSLLPNCLVDFDYNIYLEDLFKETVAWATPMLPCLLLLGFILETFCRPPILVGLFLFASAVSVAIIMMYSFTILLLVEAVIKVLLVCCVNIISVVLIEEFPCNLRCTAHGIMRSFFHLSSLCAISIYSVLLHHLSLGALLFPAALSVGLTFAAALLSYSVHDNSNVLL